MKSRRRCIRYWVEVPSDFSGVIAGKKFIDGQHYFRDNIGSGTRPVVYFKTFGKAQRFAVNCPKGTTVSRIVSTVIRGSRTLTCPNRWRKLVEAPCEKIR